VAQAAASSAIQMYLCVTARLSYSSKKRDGVGLIETNHGRINAIGESSLRAP
jgi:hypothetical protein